MYKDIPDIEPLNDDVQIWKYMDWASFTSLVLNKRLMFRRASFFKDYYDTYVDLDKLPQLFKYHLATYFFIS